LAVRGLGGGILLAATLPPWGWWPLGPLGAAVLFSAAQGRVASPRVAGRLTVGLAAGLGLYGPGLFWVTEFTAAGYVVVLGLEAVILALAVAALPARRATAVVAFPALLVLVEAVRGSWPFGGLPLGGIDLGQVGGPLAPSARLGGHLLLVALVGIAGVSVALLVRWALGLRRRDPDSPRRVGEMSSAVVLLLAVAAVAVVGAAAPRGSQTGTLRAAAVQGGGVRGLRAVESDPAGVFDAHLAASRSLTEPVDLVLWPEDVVDIDGPLAGSPEEEALAGEARRLRATLVAGVVEDADADRFRNAAVAFGPDGTRGARYDKVHRVPFGEYVPARGLFESLADLSAVPRDAIAGRGSGRLDTPAGRFGVVISYEVFFAGRARSAIGAGGQLLLVPTNASSYRRSQVPAQEVAVARLRAIETGRWVIQAAPTGYSAVIDQTGRVFDRTPLGRRAVIVRTVGLRTGSTFATRLGDAPMAVAAMLAVVLAWAADRFLPRRTGDVFTRPGGAEASPVHKEPGPPA